MKNKKKHIILSILVSTVLLQFSTLAQEMENEPPTQDEIRNREIEERALNDQFNLNYYPKLQLGTPALFTGAATPEFNEIFGRIGILSSFPISRFDENGNITSSDALAISLTPTVNLGWGIIDNLFFTATVPYRYSFINDGVHGISDPWISMKYRFLKEPVQLALQVDAKIPVGDISKVPPTGDGQFDTGGMILATKSFGSFFAQVGAGYKYRLPLTTSTETIKYNDQIPYILDIGMKMPFLNALSADVAVYGYIPVGGTTRTSTLLSVRPNIQYNFSNLDANLSVTKSFLGYNTDNDFGIHAGLSYKTSFNYPKTFDLLLLPKVDPEDLEIRTANNVELGKNYYANLCSKCHMLISPEVFPINKWEGILSRYKNQKFISQKEENEIRKFLTEYINNLEKVGEGT